MIRYTLNTLLFLLVYFGLDCHGQNPLNLTIGASSSVYNVDTYKRATNSILLTNGFNQKTSGNARLNLSISSNPITVNSNYSDPLLSPFPGFNTNAEVGVTNGSYAVLPNGSFSYNIPIICSPGMNAIEPNLTLSYNSEGINGWLGIGWNLSGLSNITRCVKNTFNNNGSVSPINLDYSDFFVLDGNRLISKTGSYGHSGTTYRCEIENYSQITSFGNQGNGPQYFEVTDNKGKKYEYGKLNNSVLQGVGNTTSYSWYINKVTDEFGNYMDYFYSNSNGEILIDKISYTGNSNGNIQPYNEIQFEYIERSDENAAYFGGAKFNNKHLLKSITCLDINKSITKKYVFTYQFNIYSQLNKITEVDANGNDLNPTIIRWGEPNPSNPPTGTNMTGLASTSDLIGIKVADINGDGFSDIIGLRNSTYNGFIWSINSLANNYLSSFPTYGLTFHPANNSHSSTGGMNVGDNLGMFVIDEDDNTKQEVIACFRPSPSYLHKTYEINSITTDASGQIKVTHLYSGSQSANIDLTSYNNYLDFPGNPLPFYYDANDYTGDGKKDKLISDQEYLRIIPAVGPTVSYPTGIYTMIKTADFDGDGKLEIFLFIRNSGGIYDIKVLSYSIINNSASLNVLASFQKTIFGGNQYLMKCFDIGDFNGDGKADIVYRTNGIFGSTYIRRSNGTNFENEELLANIVATTPANVVSVSLRDINRDNKSDLVLSEQISSTAVQYYVLYSTGNSLTGYYKFNITGQSKFGDFGDFNGDGNTDFYQLNDNNTEDFQLKPFAKQKELFVTKIENAKKSLEISYENMASRYGLNSQLLFYNEEPSTSINSPLKIYRPNTIVVSKIKDYGKNILFGYINGVLHKDGRGFLGFEKVKSWEENDLTGSVTTNTFNSVFSLLEKSETINGKFKQNIAFTFFTIKDFNLDNSKIASKNYTQNYFSAVNPGNSLDKSLYLFKVFNKSVDYLKSTKLEQTILYDKNFGGNITSDYKETYNWAGNQFIRNEDAQFTYILNNGVYKVLKIVNTNFQYPDANYVRTMDYNYDAQGHITDIINDIGAGNLALTTNYSNFNVFGYPTQITISAGDIQPRTSQKFYDPTGRFVVKTINPLGHVEEFIYEPKFGKIIQSTGINGLISKFQYDGLGRVISTTSPNNITSTIRYEWDKSAIASYSVITSGEGSPKQTKLYNGLDNLVSTEKEGFNGIKIVSSITYDSKNRIIESKEPHYSNQTKYMVTKYSYEPDFFRIEKEENYIYNAGNLTLKNKTEYTYNAISNDLLYNKGFVDIKGPNSIRVKTENNEAGQNDRIINYDNSLQNHISEYTFSSSNQPKVVKLTFPDGAINTTQIGYDALGNRNQITEPNSGAFTFQYNSIGQKVYETNPNGNFTYNYDLIGRLQSKVGSVSGTTNYQYVTSSNGLGQIEKITGPNVVTDFKYDNLNRKTEISETIGNKVFKTNYTFDKYDRIVDYTYPSGFSTKNEYDAIGNLIRIKSSNQVLWQLNNLNTPYMIGQYTYGNGLVTNVKTDNYLNLNEILSGSLLKQTYQVNNVTGNVEKRDVWNFNTNNYNYEHFSYDGYQRLTQVYDFNAGFNIKTAINYAPNGNITQKTDAGNYVYGIPTKPYTITNINNATNNIGLSSAVYNDILKVKEISEVGTNNFIYFKYGNDNERIQTEYLINGVKQYTRYYAENYDREETSTSFREWNYVFAPSGLAAIYYNNNGTGKLMFVTTDHLGSPLLLTDDSPSQNIIEEYSFDAWGRRRNPINWSYTGISPSQILIRGYTFHEQYDNLNLIDMNGRVYDPVLGRFIQPDKFIQAPDFLQNHNRYAYVLNNPLKYNDPTGQIWNYVIGAVIGGAINVYTHWDKIQSGGSPWLDGLAAFGIGAVSGAIGVYTFGPALAAAGGLAGGFSAGAYAGAQSALYSSAVLSYGNNAYFQDPLFGPKEYATSMTFGAILGGVGNGIAAKMAGLDFWGRNYNVGPKIMAKPAPDFEFEQFDDDLKSISNKSTNNNSSVDVTEENIALVEVKNADGSSKWVKSSVSDGKYTYTKTAAKHMDEFVKSGDFSGELSRPYMKSTLTVENIMKSGVGVKDASYPGGYNWIVPGSYRGSSGYWQLGINPETNVIYHFNFVR